MTTMAREESMDWKLGPGNLYIVPSTCNGQPAQSWTSTKPPFDVMAWGGARLQRNSLTFALILGGIA